MRTVGRAIRQTEGRSDMTKLIVAFRNFANAPIKNAHIYIYQERSLFEEDFRSKFFAFPPTLPLTNLNTVASATNKRNHQH